MSEIQFCHDLSDKHTSVKLIEEKVHENMKKLLTFFFQYWPFGIPTMDVIEMEEQVKRYWDNNKKKTEEVVK